MAANRTEPVIQELRHEPLPGHRKLFFIVAAVALAYLALILASSPGKVKKAHGDKTGTTSSHAQP